MNRTWLSCISLLAVLVGSALAGPGVRAQAPSGPGTDPRFGVAVAVTPADLAAGLRTAGVQTWYTFAGGTADPRTGRVELVRPGVNLQELGNRATAKRGGTYLIGNEVNVPGQDDLAPAAYADFLHQVAATLRTADPSAVLVGPNVLNWDATCTGCVGFTAGHLWSDAFVSSYQSRYGALPLNAWGMHTYSVNWDRQPLIDAPQDQAQMTAARQWLDSRGLSLPIWNTEFGIIWGYEGIRWAVQPDGVLRAEPVGPLRSDLILGYIDQMLDWFTRTGPSLRVERWFVYSLVTSPEPWTTAPAGIGLIQPNGLALTAFGERYRAWTVNCTAPSRPVVAVTVAPSGSERLQVSIAAAPGPANVKLRELRFGQAANARIDLPGGPSDQSGNFTASLTQNPTQTTFVVRRAAPGGAATVPLVVVDSCGEWPTLVGGGPNAFATGPSSSGPAPAPSATPTPAGRPAGAAPTATAMPTPPSAPTLACAPRPPVAVTSAPDGAGRLRVTIAASGGGNALQALRVGAATNAHIEAGGQSGAGNLTVPLPAGTQQTSLMISRTTAGQATTVNLVVVDGCGEWPSLVGGGPTAF